MHDCEERKITLEEAVSDLGFDEPGMTQEDAMHKLQRLVQVVLRSPGMELLTAGPRQELAPPEVGWSPIIDARAVAADGTPYELTILRATAHGVRVADAVYWEDVGAKIIAGGERGGSLQNREIVITDEEGAPEGRLVSRIDGWIRETHELLDPSSGLIILNADFDNAARPEDEQIAALARELRRRIVQHPS